MIEKARITSGYAKKLPLVKRMHRVKFSPGINILWGPNGCGKTSILQIIAAHTFCYSGGWTRLLEPLELGNLGASKNLAIPESLAFKAPGRCTAELTWDKTSVFLANGKDEASMSFIPENSTETPDGITTPLEFLTQRMDHKSSGEQRRHKLTKIIQMIQRAPDFRNAKPRKDLNPTWAEVCKKQLDYLQTGTSTTDPNLPAQKPTVLFDEPERHLDLKLAAKFWLEILPKISEIAQVIVATHHPFALKHLDTANWITNEKNEGQEALKTYREILG